MVQKVSTVRCLWCRKRFDVELHVKKTKCPSCGKDWNVSWPWSDSPDDARLETEA